LSPKRGDRAAPPAVGTEFEVRFANNEAATGWDQLAKQMPGNVRRAFEAIRSDPRSRTSPGRQHRLKGSLANSLLKGEPVERWQYEVTGGGRIWYLIDDANRTAWITYAGSGHPKATD
jgi:hypothetical protein